MKSKFHTLLLAASIAGLCSSCSVSVSARGSLFKKDAVEAEKVAGLARATAKTLLAAGGKAADVEQIVRSTGVDADSARRIVAEVQAELAKQ